MTVQVERADVWTRRVRVWLLSSSVLSVVGALALSSSQPTARALSFLAASLLATVSLVVSRWSLSRMLNGGKDGQIAALIFAAKSFSLLGFVLAGLASGFFDLLGVFLGFCVTPASALVLLGAELYWSLRTDSQAAVATATWSQ